MSEKDCLIVRTEENSHVEIKVYRRRWYILFLFSMLALYQATVSNTWGPVAKTVEEVFDGWDNGTISLFVNWCSIAFLAFLFPSLYLTEKNLRWSILVGSGLVFLGTAVRCLFLFTSDISDYNFTALCHLGAILNGIPSIVVTSAPPAVSAAWFPPEERVTATSISQMLNNIGIAVSFLMASLLVPENLGPDKNNTGPNETHLIVENATHTSHDDFIRWHVDRYLTWMSGLAGVLFVLILVYFPAKPPMPPSISSSQERLNFSGGIWTLMKSPTAWILAIVWAIPQSVWNNWCIMMVVSLTKIGVNGDFLSERWVNILGIMAVVVGTCTAIFVGMLTDKMKGYMKYTIIALLAAGGTMFTFLSLVSTEAIKMPSLFYLQICVYILLLSGNSLVVSTSPLCFEFAVEKFYPVPEGIVGGWLNIWYNIITIIFLGIFNIPGVGTGWLNYVLPLGCFMVIPLLMGIKEEYKRTTLDLGHRITHD